MHALITYKYEKNPIKNNRENVDFVSLLYVYGFFFRRSRAANSVVRDQTRPNFELNQALMYVIVTCIYEKDPIKNSRENVIIPFSLL